MKGGGGRGIRQAEAGPVEVLEDQAVSGKADAGVYREMLHAGRDIPILFSAPMVRALLDGRKTQTRRVIEPEPHGSKVGEGSHLITSGADFVREVVGHFRPRWKRSDRLWVRETWQTGMDYAGPQIAYRATGDTHDIDAWDDEDDGVGPSFNYACCPSAKWHTWLPDLLSGAEGSWRPGIHMPRWASRLTLAVTDVRVERLQDISEEDAKAEGAGLYVPGHGFITDQELRVDPGYSNFLAPRMGFEAVWTEINGEASWDANPFVVALTFTVHRANIDALPSSLPGRAQA